MKATIEKPATDARIEEVANLLMDMRMDGPWWKPPSTLTYQEAMRHYAIEIVKALDELAERERG